MSERGPCRGRRCRRWRSGRRRPRSRPRRRRGRPVRQQVTSPWTWRSRLEQLEEVEVLDRGAGGWGRPSTTPQRWPRHQTRQRSTRRASCRARARRWRPGRTESSSSCTWAQGYLAHKKEGEEGSVQESVSSTPYSLWWGVYWLAAEMVPSTAPVASSDTAPNSSTNEPALGERESSSITTYWSESSLSSR